METDIKIQPIAGLLILALLLCLSIPTLRIPMEDDANKATYQRRALTPFPARTEFRLEPEVYFQTLQKWYEDRVGFSIRSSWIRRQVSFHLFRDSPAPNILIGKSGMLFLSAHSPVSDLRSIEESCPPMEDWPTLFQKTQTDWRAIQRGFRANGLDPYLLVFPSKKALYPEHLPGRVPEDLQERCQKLRSGDSPVSRLARAYPNHVIDAYPVLEPHKNKPHFYPPENFHADGEAAIRAVEALIFRMLGEGGSPQEIEPYVAMESRSDLSHLLGFSLANESRQISGFDPAELQPAPHYENKVRRLLGVPVWARRYQNLAARRDEKVMLITNSFGIRAAPYFARQFSRVDAVSTNRLIGAEQHEMFFEQLVFEGGYDHVVFILHDESVFKHRLGKFASGLE